MKKLTLLLVMVAATTAIVACSKGNNGASRGYNPIYPGGVVPGCTTCTGTPRTFLSGARASHSTVEMTLDLIGDASRMYNPLGDPSKDYVYYNGYVQAYGTAYLNGLCGMQGQVSVQTRQVGTYSSGRFGQMILELSNGIQLQVSSGEVYQYGTGLHLIFTPTNWNGQPCDFPVETY